MAWCCTNGAEVDMCQVKFQGARTERNAYQNENGDTDGATEISAQG